MGNSYQSPSNGAYLQIFRYSLKDAEKVTIRLLFDSTTKATLSGFLVALCARDSGGGSEVCGVVQTLKALW